MQNSIFTFKMLGGPVYHELIFKHNRPWAAITEVSSKQGTYYFASRIDGLKVQRSTTVEIKSLLFNDKAEERNFARVAIRNKSSSSKAKRTPFYSLPSERRYQENNS